LIGFALGIVMPDYLQVIKEIPDAKHFYEKDPHVLAFYHLMYQINRTIRRKVKGCSVAFVYDQSPYSDKVGHAFGALKLVHPIASRSMKTFAPLDDKDYPALQTSDLLADVIREAFERWLSRGKPRYVPIESKWNKNVDFVGKFDRDYMLNAIKKTLASKRFIKGMLPVRLGSRRQQRRERKAGKP
jgi:hypothetical protein